MSTFLLPVADSRLWFWFLVPETLLTLTWAIISSLCQLALKLAQVDSGQSALMRQEVELIAIKKTLPSLFLQSGWKQGLETHSYSQSEYSKLHLEFYLFKTNEHPAILTRAFKNLSNICPALPSSACGYIPNDASGFLIKVFGIKVLWPWYLTVRS